MHVFGFVFFLLPKVLLDRRESDPAAGSTLAAAKGRKRKFVQATNMHIVSGSKELFHEIPGKKPEQRTRFKQSVVFGAVEQALHNATHAAAEDHQQGT